MVWLQVFSNALIGVAYVAISSTLVYLVWRVRGLPFHWMYVAFGVFIVSCGLTHFMDVVTIWKPVYWLDVTIRCVTAVVSIGTAAALPGLVPKALAITNAARIVRDRGTQLETAYKELEVVYDKARQLDHLKTQFFANISHELRTPLTLILGPVDRVLKSDRLGSQEIVDLETIRQNGRALLRRVNDLLEVARLEAGKTKPRYVQTNLTQMLRVTGSYFDVIAEDKGIAYHLHLSPRVDIPIDPEMIQRVILNLLSNAFKFTPVGGKVDVFLRVEGKTVVIEVLDDGIGIPNHLREVVFERFRQIPNEGPQGKSQGTGLGLAISKEFIELHKGKIWVREGLEKGACFVIELPMVVSAGTLVSQEKPLKSLVRSDSSYWLEEFRQFKPRPSSQPHLSSKLTKGRVLIVEDNRSMSQFLCDTLSENYEVITAFDGKEGLQKVVKYSPDLIVTDLMMPLLSGDQMVARLRQDFGLKDIPILVLTAKADDDLKNQLLADGVQDYVVKPFSVEEIEARVSNLVMFKRVRDLLRQEVQSQTSDLETLTKQLAQKRKQLELAVASRDEFLSIASHELKTPLTSLRLSLQLMEKSFSNRQELMGASDLFSTSLRQVETLTHLVEELLDVTRIQAGQLNLSYKETNLTEVIDDIVRRFSGQLRFAKCSIELDVDPNLVGHWDKSRIDQVLVNLISNALKYAPGKLIKISAKKKDGWVTIVVEDEGPGIEPDHQSIIFERYTRANVNTRVGGLGLGLFIVKKIVDAHRGTVKLQSKPGEGASFAIGLPLRPEEDKEGLTHAI